jgi:hypothetical protein
LITFGYFSKAALVHSVAETYAGKKITIAMSITLIQKVLEACHIDSVLSLLDALLVSSCCLRL